ncbi:hypothetical protein GCK72_003098 [Caenorhabditis remanei]|uniref:Uncharacterized protein n=1 Tax=Caenorhabditis remanei TaxID=31234 RepID=A0A6A5HYG3_CAERE|nr:hypothetical protein GCK72_003098 [Caenorhabditis remanei]KAF1771272.1 hypothetical protein GCK72_003098 [Caenorhabditis remanei]
MQSANQMLSMNQMPSSEEFLKQIEKGLNENPMAAQILFEHDDALGMAKLALENEKNLPEKERKFFWKTMDLMCNAFMKAPAYKNGNKKHNGYKICCEMADYCSFYKQTWFFIVCGAVGFLLLVGIAGGIFFIIRRKNKKIGGGNPKKVGGSKP